MSPCVLTGCIHTPTQATCGLAQATCLASAFIHWKVKALHSVIDHLVIELTTSDLYCAPLAAVLLTYMELTQQQ